MDRALKSGLDMWRGRIGGKRQNIYRTEVFVGPVEEVEDVLEPSRE